MPNFSLVVRLEDATAPMLEGLIQCLEAQTSPDWELVLVSGQTASLDRQLAADLAAVHDRVRNEVRPDGERLQWSINALLPGLGNWVGCMGQRDQLLPTALAELELAIAAHPEAKIVFTDEEARNQHGHISLRWTKGAVNPVRLRTQECLRDLVIVDRTWLQDLGGFDRMASDWPAHDLYLRTLELRGAAAFVNVPIRLFQRFRNHMHDTTDARRRDHMVGFDLWAMRQALQRQQIPGTVRQLNGTAEIAYAWPRRLAVTLIVTADPARKPEIQEALRRSTVQPLKVVWCPLSDPFSGIGVLNEQVRLCDTPLVCFLDAVPVNAEWLAHLVDHVMLPGVGAIGARLVTPVQLSQPGLLRYRFDGWDWNTRGRFNELAVPHQVSAVSPHCLLIDVQTFLSADGFNPAYPRLFAMDLCLRLDAAGKANVLVPGAQAEVDAAAPRPDAAETAAFNAAWAGWTCRFGLHLPE